MRKGIFWFGIVILILAALLFFLSGSTSGPNLEPTVPFLYGTNQTYYLIAGVVGLIFVAAGVVMRRRI